MTNLEMIIDENKIIKRLKKNSELISDITENITEVTNQFLECAKAIIKLNEARMACELKDKQRKWF